MADTQRSKADIIALMADNTTGDISAQDQRDFVESSHLSFGGLYISSAAATTLTADTWTKAAGTTTSTNLNRFTMPANNRLTYTGTPDVHCHIAMSFTVTSASNAQDFLFGVAKNDTIDTPSILGRRIVSSSEMGAAAVHTDLTLSTGDYIEMFVQNDTGSNNATLDYGYLFAMGMFA